MDLRVLCNLRLPDARQAAKTFGLLKLVVGASVATFIVTDVCRFCSHSVKGDSLKRWRALLGNHEQGGDSGDLQEAMGAEPTVIYDCRGRPIATLRGESVALEDVSDVLWQAVVASEDRRFFNHNGVDVRGLTRAVVTLGGQGGGSSITQQLVKNVLLSHDRTLTRKAVEMLLAVALEAKLTKPQLLEEYLNNIYWGHGLYGVASATAAYFRKRPCDLTLGEAALLAGMLPAPELLSPFRNPEAAMRAQRTVLQRMLDNGYIDSEAWQKEEEIGLPVSLTSQPIHGKDGDLVLQARSPDVVPYRAPFFVSEVLFQLREQCGDLLQRRGGLHIYTTLDLALQEKAERLLKEDGQSPVRGTPDEAGEAALVAIEPATGAVRTLVGGRDFSQSPYNRAVLAARSPGSAFKPVVYLAALAEGVATSTSVLDDEETQFDTWDEYKPQNFYRTFKGQVTLRDSLADSLNVPSVKLLEMVGAEKVVALAQRLGIKSELLPVPSLALGGCEVTPMELAATYSTIAAGGIYSHPHLVTRVKDRNGTTIFRHKGHRRVAVAEAACKEMHKMLRSAVTKGTGRAATTGWSASAAAGKTGTSDDYRDAWFAGYTPSLACVVWVGNDNNESLLGSGAILAAPLWAKFMRAAQGVGANPEKGQERRRQRRTRWQNH